MHIAQPTKGAHNHILHYIIILASIENLTAENREGKLNVPFRI